MKKKISLFLLGLCSLVAVSVYADNQPQSNNGAPCAAVEQCTNAPVNNQNCPVVPCDTVAPCTTVPCAPAPCAPAPCAPVNCDSTSNATQANVPCIPAPCAPAPCYTGC